MYDEFEVRWDAVLPATPEQVWDAVTARAAGWIWPMEFEPRVGGAERGLTSNGTVTAWDPPRHFQTRAERPDGWTNALDYTLEPHAEGTLVRYVHNGTTDDYAVEYDACVQHTAFYRHSLTEYLSRFAGRDAAYVELEAAGTMDEVCRRLGIPGDANVGDEVALVSGTAATVDYRTPAFLGLRAADTLVRVYGREAWGGPVSVALHLFADDADAGAEERAWSAWLSPVREAA
jgi:uncharacterized protein YndB with AHSA1/START domain